MKTSKYLSVVMSIGAVWMFLGSQSTAQASQLELPVATPAVMKRSERISVFAPKRRLLAQNVDSTSTDVDINKDLQLQNITITQNRSDKSLLTVKGSINNRSEQVHYVYYVVAKFISNDTAIKQTIIPVNIDIGPGKSQSFTHEISTDIVNSIATDTLKPLVVKYEYR
ncbi:MAG: hypothetical protein LH474_11380 [Chamaesiphon sp.]|nr:hypothetical protein [Chamaesiphon sp.]